VTSLCPAPRWASWSDDGPEPEPPPHPEAYRLAVRGGAAAITASSELGGFRAATTLEQLRRSGPVDDLTIVDWPEFDRRAVLLDVARGRVPTIDELATAFGRFAELKYTHVLMNLEASFDHPGLEQVCRPHDPYTVDDVRRLVELARGCHLELVPVQASLGHLEHFLAHPDLAHLAALPGGYRTPDGSGHEPPACLDPDQRQSFELAAELVANVARAFDPSVVHVGMDEPIDLNPAVWDAIFDVPGAPVPWAEVDGGGFCTPLPADRVGDYAGWITRLCSLPELTDREVMMWGDVVAPHPDLLDAIPPRVTLVEWGYEAGHPFDARLSRITEAGRRCWVAAGTSGWSSISGRTTNMSANVREAVAAAQRHGAEGVAVTSWEVLPSVSDWPGFVWAASLAWNPDRPVDPAAALDLVVARGSGLGEVWMLLGGVHDHVVPGTPETGAVSEMFRTGGWAAVGLALRGLRRESLDRVTEDLDAAGRRLDGATTGAVDGPILRDELRWVRDALRWGVAAARFRLEWPDPLASPGWLVPEHERLVAEHARLWRLRNRHGGYDRVAAGLVATRGGL